LILRATSKVSMAEDKPKEVKIRLTKTEIGKLRELAGIKNTTSNEMILKAFIGAVISNSVIIINK